jgi:chemotaxis protein histidine kinase CheA
MESLDAIIGEDALNFEFNAGNLPPEIELNINNKSVYLKMTYNIRESKAGFVDQLLVTCLDITAEKALLKENEKQKLEMTYIKELIDCGAEKFAKFQSSSTLLLEENEKRLKEPSLSVDIIKIMFVNAHTVKGAARTLGLSAISDSIHIAETYLSNILKGIEPIDGSRLQSDADKIRAIFEYYTKINRDTLGRKDDESKVSVDKDFLSALCSLLSNIGVVEENEEIRQASHEAIEEIFSKIYLRLPLIINECFGNAERIAKDLGKLPPKITTDIIDLPTPQHIERVIRNISVHLIRNSLDHGIESSEQRLAAKKDPTGEISVTATKKDSQVHMTVRDDGKGLALGILREKGLKTGKLEANSSIEEIANLIFQSDVSTAASVSQVSGRGVGMDAVRRFVRDIGGDIKIVLGNEKEENPGFYNFEFLITFPLTEIKEA